jgi:hypothetical protein
MPTKQAKYTYQGMNRDVSKSKHPFSLYYDANNIRIIATDSQSSGSITNEKGNVKVVNLPLINIDSVNHTIQYNSDIITYKNSEIDNIDASGEQIILGWTSTRDTIIIISTNNKGGDCIWEISNLETTYDLKLLYIRNLELSVNNPIELIYNYETENIQKIYWVDGYNQLRFLNIKHSISNEDLEELIDIPVDTINIVGEYNINQPVVNIVTHNGEHTAGMIQYSYNLYKLNGSQTTISPLSDLVSLDFGDTLNGGDLNEIVGASPLVEISDLDDKYTHIKLYAIKYTSYNTIPSVSLILDEEIDNHDFFQYLDNGSVISSISLSQFIFLGSNLFIPKNITSKDNRLFASNIKSKFFDFELDMRAYSYDTGGESKIWNKQNGTDSNGMPVGALIVPSDFTVPLKHDSINFNYDVYKYHINGSTYGGEGKYIKYILLQESSIDSHKDRVFKDGEIYRIAIEFYNKYGQKSLPIWIADFKAREGNLNRQYNKLKVELKPEFYNYINSTVFEDGQKPVGYKILRANRTLNDETIIAQGCLTGMICQTTNDVNNYNYWAYESNRREESDDLVKIPTYFTRGIRDEGVIRQNKHLQKLNDKDFTNSNYTKEILTSTPSAGKRQHSWQYNKMMQLYSPDLMFDAIGLINSSLRLKIKGVYMYKRSNIWYKQLYLPSLNFYRDGNIENISTYNSSGDGIVQMKGVIGPFDENDDHESTSMVFKRFHHAYMGYATVGSTYSIYGKPEITERGQSSKLYFNDIKFKYNNSLDNFLSDKYDAHSGGSSRNDEVAIRSLNAYNAKCITLVEGTDSQQLEYRKALEELYPSLGYEQRNAILIAELYYDLPYIYQSNIYGGSSYESKTRNEYIGIGTYNKLNVSSVIIKSPGDIYVQNFKFGRVIPTDVKKLHSSVLQLSESLEYITETKVNLKNRNDYSTKDWDAKFQPNFDEYNKYNRVYSQQSNLIKRKAKSFKFKKNDSFDTRIIASKLKLPGESIDNWTDFLENEIMDLDGKYGSITSLINFNDNVYAIQDRGVAYISINPRVQMQGNDSLSIELGSGGLLSDYKYLTTTSGSINKWSITISPTGFYYFDLLNKALYKSNGQNVINLSDKVGFHSYFENNINYIDLKIDNPLLKKGISSGFDILNNNMYITFLQKQNNITLNFNENINNLESFHDYHPSIYINKDSKMLTTAQNGSLLYEHGKGDYQTFYDEKYISYITLQINPESDLDCVFNNIEFKSEIYLNDIDQPQNTLTHISAWNEYQKTNRIPLILGRNKNLRRKFRKWSAQIPREAGTRNRIRNPWIFLKLELDTTSNFKMVLHDIIVNYNI